MRARNTGPNLSDRIPSGGTDDPDEVLDRFLGWVADQGLEPYPAQEEALLELMLGKHVVLSTPTGSGKSLVALGLHFQALCAGERSFYTAPVKALASEKFFELCAAFGAENVGMLTGDASINHEASIICCTTEVLANMALRQGAATDAPHVVLDEFHFYADRERGVAWQVPLLALPQTRFLLMSATLGNTAPQEARLRDRSGREVAHVHSDVRPVPLDFDYRETPLHQTLEDLVARNQAPVYVVHFTQRECGEQAQGLTSARLCSREEKRVLAEELAPARFDTPYGKDLQRFLRNGIGVHHAGLLPRYRLLVERLAQKGLLRVICGTDTLGVGVNIPIRTVVFSRLCKFDGEKVAILRVREFKQISGRAGRKGFDEQGSVVCQAPEHVIENRRIAAKEAASGAKKKKPRRKPPTRGFVPWNRETFERLIERPPEALESRFEVDHGMIMSVLQREDADRARGGGYRELIELIELSHGSAASKRRLRRRAAMLFRALWRAGVVRVDANPNTRRAEVRIAEELQRNFSLHNALSLYLVEAVSALDPESPRYGAEVLTLVESILENPRPVLAAQVQKRKGELVARLKAEGVPYEERMKRLEEVTYPKPDEEFIEATFRLFAQSHPWVGEHDIHPKGVAREMFEEFRSFGDYARDYNMAPFEGVLLRYLSQVHNTVVKSVPEPAKSQAVYDVVAFFHAMLQRVDSSLLEAWQSLLAPGTEQASEADTGGPAPFDLALDERILRARVRAELHALVGALAAGDFEEAALCVRQDPEDPWDAARFRDALAPFFEEYERLVFTPEARENRHTLLKAREPRRWDAVQVLVDPAGDGMWAVDADVDLSEEKDPEGPLVRVRRIGT